MTVDDWDAPTSFTPSINAIESLLFPDWGWSGRSSWEGNLDLSWRPSFPVPGHRAASHEGLYMAVPQLGLPFPFYLAPTHPSDPASYITPLLCLLGISTV